MASTPSAVATDMKFRVEKALEALLKWKDSQSTNEKLQLLPQDDFVYVTLSLKKIPPKPRAIPFRIPLPHPLLDASAELCLIIDDRSPSNLTKDAAQEIITKDAAKEIIKSKRIPVAKVLTLSKVKTNYKPFEARRKLCDSYDMFFADKRVFPMLPRLLGKYFIKKRKLPLPVNLLHKNWKKQIGRICSSALLFMKTGTCSVAKVAKLSMENEEIVQNVVAAIDGIADVLPKNWAAIRSLHLKLSNSLALPIYQAMPDIKLKINGGKETEQVAEGENNETLVVVRDKSRKKEELRKKQGKRKGRIHEVRYMDSFIGEADLRCGDDNEEDEDDNLGGAESLKAGENDKEDEKYSESDKADDDGIGVAELKSRIGELKKREKGHAGNLAKAERREKKKQRKDRSATKDGEKVVKNNGEKTEVVTKSDEESRKVKSKKSKARLSN